MSRTCSTIRSAYLASPVVRCAGRGVDTARTGALQDGQGAAKTARESKVIPGTHAERIQPYAHVRARPGVGERRAARRAAKKGEPSRKRDERARDSLETDDFLRSSRNVSGRAGEVTGEVADALRHGRARARPPLITPSPQGLATTKADLQKLPADRGRRQSPVAAPAPQRQARRGTAQGDQGAHAAGEAHVRETQKRYGEIVKRQEERWSISSRPDEDYPALHRARRPSRPARPRDRTGAQDGRRFEEERERGAVHCARRVANDALRTIVERTRASELGPRGKRHPDVQKAERAHRDAQRALDEHTAAQRKRVDDAEAELTAARHDAAISTQKVSRTPEWQRAQDALVAAQKELGALRKKHAGTQRTGGRLEGRAQEQVIQANARARSYPAPPAATSAAPPKRSRPGRRRSTTCAPRAARRSRSRSRPSAWTFPRLATKSTSGGCASISATCPAPSLGAPSLAWKSTAPASLTSASRSRARASA